MKYPSDCKIDLQEILYLSPSVEIISFMFSIFPPHLST